MPASDKYWRPLKRMHVVFALTTTALLGVTLTMMSKDHSREWKDYQRTAEKIETLRLQLELKDQGALSEDQLTALANLLDDEQREKLAVAEEYSESEYLARKAEIAEAITEAEEALADKRADVAPLEAEVADLAARFDLASRADRGKKAERDKARADYDLAIRDTKPAGETRALLDAYKAKEKEVEATVLAAQALNTELNAKKAALAALTSEVDELNAQLAQLETDEKRIRDTKNTIAPDNWAIALKRSLMEWPIIDGFNSHLRIRQDWLPELMETRGMTEVARFDRCRTCHLNADRVMAGNVPAFPHGHTESEDYRDWVAENEFPHPFSTHPRTDVYLTATSPHPVTEFGCTICHQGNGSGTSFQNAEHGPGEPYQAHEWEEKFGYHPNHFWEYPMHPKRFVESSCIKCHHSVVELGVNPEYGPTAPKVVEGFETIKQYGCFGCHEMHGYDGDDRIGPDLRLEPNYGEVAAQVLADEFFETSDAAQLTEAGFGELEAAIAAIVEAPLDSDVTREAVRDVLSSDANRDEPLLSVRTRSLAAGLQDVNHPGLMRKVGPSLRHIGEKTTKGWLEFWTEKPKRFRPSTRMPQFWDLTNQQDDMAHDLTPVEVAGVVQYLWDKSQPGDLLAPPADYEADPIRGASAFARKGCIACHQIDAFPEGTATFGPELSRVWAKVKPPAEGESLIESEGFRWLYTWILDPERHHPRTKMPVLYVNDPTSPGYVEGEDAAADIAAFLLRPRQALVLVEPGAEEDREDLLAVIAETVGLDPDTQLDKAAEYLTDLPRTLKHFVDPESLEEWQAELEDIGATVEVVTDDIAGQYGVDRFLSPADGQLERLARLYLSKTLTVEQAEKVLKTGEYPYPAELVKGDEIELTGDGVNVKGAEWRNRLQNYVGRKTISRYGCYACHDVPGFEMARPIGASLQDWGRKETSKLAPEHIHEWLHHHGEPDGSSTHDRVKKALGKAAGKEFASAEEAERELGPAYFYEDLVHHGRPGFLWQKLRQPRSYDYKKTETKGFDERLRMPKFPFDERKIEAVATFVLGLVAEPPAKRYLYEPDQRAHDRIEGERLLKKYNCVGCHYVEMPNVRLAIDLDAADDHFTASASLEDFIADSKARPEDVHRMLAMRPFRKGVIGTTPEGKTIVEFHGLTRQLVRDPEDLSDPDFNFHSFELWENVDLSDDAATRLLSIEGAGISVFPDDVLEVGPGRGGDYAKVMVEQGAYVKALKRKIGADPYGETSDVASKQLAWQMGPPPLIAEGFKVQTPWLYRFLRNPYRLRPMTVVRMPRFNMSRDEARALSNYFAAVDDAPYPYQRLEERDAEYAAEKQDLVNAIIASRAVEAGTPGPPPIEDYAHESWTFLGEQKKCMACHEYGDYVFTAPMEIGKTLRGPDLDRVSDRLRPEWTRTWLANPKWFLPYTGMPINFPKPVPGSGGDGDDKTPEVDKMFGSDGALQMDALRDALMNYSRLLQLYDKVPPPEPASTPPPGMGD